MKLVELALHGYDVSAALVAKSSPLYMEKIVFHIVKKLSSHETLSLCSHVAELLFSRLVPAEQVCMIFISHSTSYIVCLYPLCQW